MDAANNGIRAEIAASTDKSDIRYDTAGTLEVIAGTQESNNVLLPDATDNAGWTQLPAVLGILNTVQRIVVNNLNIGSSITLTPGIWLIYVD
ncbi:hypothetical protein [Chryseobacterium populi]|uniref:Uncharacterized protein n=1 Tax=Chryseobacterium populi TaxID=1144316 RepID=J2JU97_9FLAO|nr:hypothetical protein [Chryseobacterium populi]EJL71440.1 hypothetical protein PMI13_02388 [Chryseobacterium populi]